MVRTTKGSSFLDNWGIAISLVCLIHCAAIPFLFITSVIIGTQMEYLEKMESPMFILASIIGSISIFYTYFTLKRRQTVIFLMLGLLLIIAGGMVEIFWLESLLRVLGSAMVITSHIINKKLQKQSSV